MIITSARKFRAVDQAAYAWSGLRRFQNVDLVADKLITIHQIPEKWHADARKQAQQIRSCLTQAREYFSAAKTVSLATKPTLLYYGTMSLALAEILFKHTGDSSLDRVREQNRHHGLTMVTGSRKEIELPIAASQLRAVPMEISGERKGTFELWHRSAREYPIGGDFARRPPHGGGTTTFELLMGAADKSFERIPDSGLSLFDCLVATPSLLDYLGSINIQSLCVRGMVQARALLGEHWSSDLQITLHPNPLASSIFDQITADANWVDRIQIAEILGGIQISVAQNWINGLARVSLPQAAPHNTQEVRFMCHGKYLNEFGYLYVALYLAGNYARYFPDRWVVDVERSTPIATAIETLTELSEYRLPLLTLCELERTLFVPEA